MITMKKRLLGALVVALVASAAMADPVYTFTAAEAASMVKSFTSTGASSGTLVISTDGDYADGVTLTTLAVGFETNLHPNTTDVNPYHPWAAVGIGFPWGSVPQGDLTGYTDYSLTFANDNDDIWWVNLYMNTGWTDAPWSEPDTFSQNGWTALNPGDVTTVTMSLAGIPYLNHVTNIGFQIGASMDNLGGNPSPGDAFHVSAVPIPGAVLLGFLGLGYAGTKLRRFV
jgi:hypothetical protein